jgi:chemotaxis protein methyltransferase CheR
VPKSLLGADGVSLKPEEFRLLRDLFRARTGLHFGPEARFALERRLRDRLEVLGLTSFAEYHHHLRFHPQADVEWEEAIDLLTTNETYFFREERQLRAFRDEILPMLAEQARGRRRLAIWSAGCSTGEEAYTAAILLDQSGLFGRAAAARGDTPIDARVYGSDISRRCVTAARRGIYGASSFRLTPPGVRDKYFVDGPQGMSVVAHIRERCHFGQLNLMHEDAARLLGRADAIFCRNVLIYLDQHARRTVIDMFHERLYPGGVLLLGHSESLLNVSTAFELLHLKDDLVYRKPLSTFSAPISGGAKLR